MSRGRLPAIVLALLATGWSSSLRAENAEEVPLADAEKRLQANVDEIERRQKELETRFIDGGEAMFTAAFAKRGVSAAKIAERLKPMNGKVGSYLGAVSAKQDVYAQWLRLLGGALKVVRAKGHAVAEDLDYFDAQMAEWRAAEPLLRQHMTDMLDADAQLAAVAEKIRAIPGDEHEEERERLMDDQFRFAVQKSLAEGRFTFALTRQYFIPLLDVGAKRAQKKRIEEAASKGEPLVPLDAADKRLNAANLEMRLNLAEILYSHTFHQFVDHDRGRFHLEGRTFLDWAQRNGHPFDRSTNRFDDDLQERLPDDFAFYHMKAILDSMRTFRKAGEARLKDVEYLEKGVRTWKLKAATMKAAFWRIKPLRRSIAAQERELRGLEKRCNEVSAADDDAGRKFREEVLEPALKKAEDEEGRPNKAIDAEYDTMFQVAYLTRVFHEAPADDDPTHGEAEGADVEDHP